MSRARGDEAHEVGDIVARKRRHAFIGRIGALLVAVEAHGAEFGVDECRAPTTLTRMGVPSVSILMPSVSACTANFEAQ